LRRVSADEWRREERDELWFGRKKEGRERAR
jgi:hypothetical protein